MKKLSINFFIFYFLLLGFSFSQELRLVQNSAGKYGFVDETGDTIIPCKYDYAEPFSGGLALVKNNPKYKLIDTSGTLYDLDKYDGSPFFRHDLGEYHTGLPVIVKVWDCGFISSRGNMVLELPYTDAYSFKNGKAKVINGDKYNYISKSGFLLGDWKPLEDDYHVIKGRNGKYGYIDKNGKLVIPYEFIKAKDFKNGYGQISNGHFWALINKKGEKISDWYEVIHDFQGECAIVEKLGNYGFIDKNGRFIGKWYNSIEPIGYGLYKVEKYGKYGIVNNTGYLITQWFDKIYQFKNGYLKVEKNGKYAYLNNIGAMVIGWYDNVSDVIDDIIFIHENGKVAFYNTTKFFQSEFYDSLTTFTEGIAIAMKNGKFGYIKKDGTKITDFEFDYASPFNAGLAAVIKNNKTAYIDKNGKVFLGWFDRKQYYFKEPPQGLIVVKIGSKYGFETINGKRVIPAKYDYAENFSEGVALVKNNPRIMYIDTNGVLKDPSVYPKDKSIRLDWGYGHTEKPIKITVWDCAYINTAGEIVLKVPYNDARSFRNGKAMVIKGDKYNFIDHKGKLLDKWKEFPDDYHAVEKNGKFGYINKNNRLVIPYKFNYAEDFKNGRAKVKIRQNSKSKYAYINRKGEFITDLFDDITDFKNNLAIASKNGLFALVDTSGKIISDWYEKIYPFKEGYARVEKNGKFAFINTKGKLISNWYEDAYDYSDARAKVKLGGKWGYLDKKGELIIPTIYDNAWNFENNIAKVEKNGKFAFIDIQGNPITDWFDRIYFFSDERAVVVKNKKWGYIDINGRVVIPLIYDRAFAFANGVALVYKNGKMIKIDKDGQPIENNNQ